MNGRYVNQKKQNETWQIQNRRLRSQTSRKRISTTQSEISQRYEQLQRILIQQNQNLKEQNLFLMAKIRKITKKEKSYKLQLQDINYRVSMQESYISKVEEDFSQLKNFVQDNIENLVFMMKANNLEQMKHYLSGFINNISQILCLKLKEKRVIQKIKVQQQPKNTQPINLAIDQQIDQLKIRLEALIKQNNNSCKQSSVRRECITIARQIKQLKDKKRTNNFSLPQAQDDFSQFQHQNSKRKTIQPNSNRQKGFCKASHEQTIIQMYQTPENKEVLQRQRTSKRLRESKAKTLSQSKFVKFKVPFQNQR